MPFRRLLKQAYSFLTSLVAALPEIITAIVEAIPQIIEGIITAVLEAIPQIIQAGIDLLVSPHPGTTADYHHDCQCHPGHHHGYRQCGHQQHSADCPGRYWFAHFAYQNLPTIIVEIVKAVPQIITGIVNALARVCPSLPMLVKNLVKGLWSGIQSLASWLWDKVSGWISSIWDGICDFFGIASPSKEMGWVGQMLLMVLQAPLSDNGRDAVKAAGAWCRHQRCNARTSKDMETALPTDFHVDGDIGGAITSAASGAVTSGLQLVLNITNFNNYSSEDIQQLTNEVMVTAGQFAKRKGSGFCVNYFCV